MTGDVSACARAAVTCQRRASGAALFAAAGVRVLARRAHLGRALYESAVDEHLHFDASVLLAPRERRVVGHRVQLAVAVGRDDAPQRDVVALDEVAYDRVGPPLTQSAVGLRRAFGACEAAYFKPVALRAQRLLPSLMELMLGAGQEHGPPD